MRGGKKKNPFNIIVITIINIITSSSSNSSSIIKLLIVIFNYVTKSWGPGAHCSKANTLETRLVERKVCFIPEAGNWGRRWTNVQMPTLP